MYDHDLYNGNDAAVEVLILVHVFAGGHKTPTYIFILHRSHASHDGFVQFYVSCTNADIKVGINENVEEHRHTSGSAYRGLRPGGNRQAVDQHHHPRLDHRTPFLLARQSSPLTA
jgi:hypothetical protein